MQPLPYRQDFKTSPVDSLLEIAVQDFAVCIGLAPKQLKQLLASQLALSPTIAEKLGGELSVPSEFWLS